MNEFFVAGSGALKTLTYVYIHNNIFEKEKNEKRNEQKS